jgi:hypothetical protein
MEDCTESVRPYHAPEDSEVIFEQILKVEVSVEELVHQLVPFPVILIIPCGIPKILIELPVCKSK